MTSRREFLTHAAAIGGGMALGSQASTVRVAAGSRKSSNAPTSRPLIHVADLYRPHDDPDDHWDLATLYALAYAGDVDLLGILADNPENLRFRYTRGQNPDVAAVAQLNYLTDLAVPITTGTMWPTASRGEKVREDNLPTQLRGVNMLLELLRRSPDPVAITLVGCCQDVAIAGKKEPRLLREKCAAIYLNAGVSSQDPVEQMNDKGDRLEWNAAGNPGAYATMFELPCPIYWMPCFDAHNGPQIVTGRFSPWYSLPHSLVLPFLSESMQAFFASMLTHDSGSNWLSYLVDPNSKQGLEPYIGQGPGMVSTAAFIHAAGKTVTLDGDIVSLAANPTNAAYEFVPIEVQCNDQGITQWHPVEKAANRYIFKINDEAGYTTAMRNAVKTILMRLP